jgi:hypothetical protein
VPDRMLCAHQPRKNLISNSNSMKAHFSAPTMLIMTCAHGRFLWQGQSDTRAAHGLLVARQLPMRAHCLAHHARRRTLWIAMFQQW